MSKYNIEYCIKEVSDYLSIEQFRRKKLVFYNILGKSLYVVIYMFNLCSLRGEKIIGGKLFKI